VNYILNKGELVKDFTVIFPIKQGSNAETYRVRGTDGKLYFLKLFNYAKLHRTAFDSENNLLEIEFLKKIQHENIVNYHDSGELLFENKRYGYLILDFIAGETLFEKINREPISNYYDIQQIIGDVLKGLKYLHGLPEPIIHNELTPQNIMLDLSGDIPKATIIDFGYARLFHQSTKSFNKEGLNLNYIATECFNNIYSPQSDLYSVGAIMYYMIFGRAPWFRDISKYQEDRNKTEEIILEARSKALNFPELDSDFIGLEDSVKLILKKALSQDPDYRFSSADEFIKAIYGEIEVEDIDKVRKVKSTENNEKKFHQQKAKGKGFDAIAGMAELKEQLQGFGFEFISESDTEVILSLYEYYGPSSFAKLDGMFAFSIFDKNNGKV
jgi:transitional endoplasmic reticulum ATPase